MTTCVVLVPEETGIDSTLRSALETETGHPVIHHEPLLAMAELCVRSHLARHDGPADEPERIHLVVVDPPSFAGWDLMHRAVRRYVPAVEISSYEGGVLRELGRTADPECTPRSSDGEENDPATGPCEDDAPPRMTREEIRMLLDGGHE